MPNVNYGGQGGLGDVALHPDYADNGLVYLTYAEEGVGGTSGAAIARGVLDLSGRRGRLTARLRAAERLRYKSDVPAGASLFR